LATFIAIDHEIRAFKDVVLPLLAILPIYLVLTSVNTWWAAQHMARFGLQHGATQSGQRTFGLERTISACCGLAFGIAMALWYVRSVSK